MKRLLVLVLVIAISCKDSELEKVNHKHILFERFSDSFRIYNLKGLQKMVARDRDSAYYFLGKSGAFYEAESLILKYDFK
jgi:hypothetical protein